MDLQAKKPRITPACFFKNLIKFVQILEAFIINWNYWIVYVVLLGYLFSTF